MKQWLSDFKQFAIKGNAIDMAIGIVIGAAFGKIVSTLVSAIISPIVALLTDGVDFSNMKVILRHAVMDGDKIVKPEVIFGYGDLIQALIDFIIIALVIFWIVRILAKLNKPKPAAPAPPPPTPEEVLLLRDIKDILSNKDSK